MRGSRIFHHTEKVGGGLREGRDFFSTVTIIDHTLQLPSTHNRETSAESLEEVST
jgi:hypothetical protein